MIIRKFNQKVNSIENLKKDPKYTIYRFAGKSKVCASCHNFQNSQRQYVYSSPNFFQT